MTDGVECVKAKVRSLFQLGKIGFFATGFVGDSCEIDSIYLDRPYLKSSSTDGIKIAKIFDVRNEAAAVGKAGDVFADKEVTVSPFHVVFTAPLCKILVDELTILAKERIGQNREGHHVLAANIADNIHECLFVFDNVINFINHIRAIRKSLAAKDRFEI